MAKDSGEEAIQKAALETGMRYMSDDGIEKVNQGITTIAELLRVIYVREEDAAFLCPNCGESVRKDDPNCPYCGYVLIDKCPECGEVRDPNWKFCPACGKKFQ
jgi:predicted RNA-binding Zn-ribbon protein involved in translation (DUF1610 family)